MTSKNEAATRFDTIIASMPKAAFASGKSVAELNKSLCEGWTLAGDDKAKLKMLDATFRRSFVIFRTATLIGNLTFAAACKRADELLNRKASDRADVAFGNTTEERVYGAASQAKSQALMDGGLKPRTPSKARGQNEKSEKEADKVEPATVTATTNRDFVLFHQNIAAMLSKFGETNRDFVAKLGKDDASVLACMAISTAFIEGAAKIVLPEGKARKVRRSVQ